MGLASYVLDWTKLGIRRGDLVLEVGSGAYPLARSDVLCDMFIDDSIERAFDRPVVVDRPFVCANAEELPFRDGVFDFLFSNHVLEHLIHPERFLEEAVRVSSRGCIVTPSEFCETIMPQGKHLWKVSVDGDRLVLRQKRQANEAQMPGVLHQAWLEDRHFRRFFDSRPDLFETQFTWVENLTHSIFREEERPDWLAKGQVCLNAGPAAEAGTTSPLGRYVNRAAWAGIPRATRRSLSKIIRLVHSRPSVSLDALLACPLCHEKLARCQDQKLACTGCERVYPVRADGIPMLLSGMGV